MNISQMQSYACSYSYIDSSLIHGYHILLVNSHSYHKFQVEIGAVTNRPFNIEIAHKA